MGLVYTMLLHNLYKVDIISSDLNSDHYVWSIYLSLQKKTSTYLRTMSKKSVLLIIFLENEWKTNFL